jgi:tetratricopeptide (TPR) repeat protein
MRYLPHAWAVIAAIALEKLTTLSEASLITYSQLVSLWAVSMQVTSPSQENIILLQHYLERLEAIWQAALPSQITFPPMNQAIAALYVHLLWAQCTVALNQGHYPQAVKTGKKLIALAEKNYSENTLELARADEIYAGALESLSEPENLHEALKYLTRASDIKKSRLSPLDSALGYNYHLLGLVYLDLEDQTHLTQAQKHFEKAIAIYQQSLPVNHPDLAKSYNNLGNVYCELGGQTHLTQAQEYYEKAIAIYKQSLPANHPYLADSYNNLGVVYFKLGGQPNLITAQEYYEKAIEIYQTFLAANHPSLLRTQRNLQNLEKILERQKRSDCLTL